jgi:hypothetical protein
MRGVQGCVIHCDVSCLAVIPRERKEKVGCYVNRRWYNSEHNPWDELEGRARGIEQRLDQMQQVAIEYSISNWAWLSGYCFYERA